MRYEAEDTAGNLQLDGRANYTIDTSVPKPTYRYVRFIGHGDQTGVGTTRLVEINALEGSTNRLLNKVPISGESPNTGGTINKVTDGIVTMSGYPIWWMGAGVPKLTWDMGALYSIDKLTVWMYSKPTDLRATKFIVQVSKDNSVWTTVADKSANIEFQPENGWILDVAF